MFDSVLPTPVTASVRHLYLSPGHNFRGHHGGPPGEHPVLECREIRCVAGRGIEGDRYFDFKDNFKGQITFFALEVHRELLRTLNRSDVPPSAYRRNVITEGIDLNSLIGRTFVLQGLCFEGTEECAPCYWMNSAFGPGAEAALKGRGGLRAKILTDGILRVSS